jgi:hypothetical protein
LSITRLCYAANIVTRRQEGAAFVLCVREWKCE